MKTVLCYGDSITWGYNPIDGSRFRFEGRWPGVLQAALGSGYRIIEEGLSGRTVATDSWILPHRDGRSMLGPLRPTRRCTRLATARFARFRGPVICGIGCQGGAMYSLLAPVSLVWQWSRPD